MDYLTEEERKNIGDYVWKVCGALGKYYKNRDLEKVPENERVKALIDILRHGYHPAERFSEAFPEYLAKEGQEPNVRVADQLIFLLGCKVITIPENQKKFKKRFLDEILKEK